MREGEKQRSGYSEAVHDLLTLPLLPHGCWQLLRASVSICMPFYEPSHLPCCLYSLPCPPST